MLAVKRAVWSYLINGEQLCIARLIESIPRYEKELDRFDQQIEANKNQWRKYFKNRIDTKVRCILVEQSQKYEINGVDYDKARHELDYVKQLIHQSNNRPLICVSYSEDTQVNLNEPCLVFSTVSLNEFDWMSEDSTEQTENLMEVNNQQQLYAQEIRNDNMQIG